jgi:hypothetical protein
MMFDSNFEDLYEFSLCSGFNTVWYVFDHKALYCVWAVFYGILIRLEWFQEVTLLNQQSSEIVTRKSKVGAIRWNFIKIMKNNATVIDRLIIEMGNNIYQISNQASLFG